MKQEKQTLDYSTIISMTNTRDRREKMCRRAKWIITGRDLPLLHDGWTDEDAWRLSGTLANLIGQLKRARMTICGESNH